LSAQIFTRRVGFVKKDGTGCTGARDMWRTINLLGMDVSAAIYVKNLSDFTIAIFLDVESPDYMGVVEVQTKLPTPKPLRGPSYLSAIAAEAAKMAINAYENAEVESGGEPKITLEGKTVDLINMCDVRDFQKVPDAIELKTIVNGVEGVCSSPIYVNLEDVLNDLPAFAAAAARGSSNALKPMCFTDPFLVAVASSSIGLTVITSGAEEASFQAEFGF